MNIIGRINIKQENMYHQYANIGTDINNDGLRWGSDAVSNTYDEISLQRKSAMFV